MIPDLAYEILTKILLNIDGLHFEYKDGPKSMYLEGEIKLTDEQFDWIYTTMDWTPDV